MKKIILCFVCLFGLISCKKECSNSNSLFNNNPPESKAYQDELVKQLQNKDRKNIVYTLEKYVEKGEVTYLYFGVSDANLCATAILKAKKFDAKLDPIHKTKGQGYFGAVFQNLRFQIVQDSNKTELIYESVDRIID
jgi:hypothetical protein